MSPALRKSLWLLRYTALGGAVGYALGVWTRGLPMWSAVTVFATLGGATLAWAIASLRDLRRKQAELEQRQLAVMGILIGARQREMNLPEGPPCE